MNKAKELTKEQKIMLYNMACDYRNDYLLRDSEKAESVYIAFNRLIGEMGLTKEYLKYCAMFRPISLIDTSEPIPFN